MERCDSGNPLGLFRLVAHVGERTIRDATIPPGTPAVVYRIQAYRSTRRGPVALHSVPLGGGMPDLFTMPTKKLRATAPGRVAARHARARVSLSGLPAGTGFALACPVSPTGEVPMSILGIVLLVILILLLLGAAPAWPYSREWGYGPSGIAGLLLVIILILVLMRVI